MKSHKPPIIVAHGVESPESPTEADKAAHPCYLLLLLQVILAEKRLPGLFFNHLYYKETLQGPDTPSLHLFKLCTELRPKH